jgi:hypothetical protein
MNMSTKPHIVIKNNAQKGAYRFSDILTADILADVCQRVVGCADYTVTFDENGYNKGRLALIEYCDTITYISFSEHGKVEGRNSFFQSLTTAFTSYSSDLRPNKRIAFYFLPSISGNFEGDYFRFMYRIMATNGVEFLNATPYLKIPIVIFATIDDIIATRSANRSRNSKNNSTYITRNSQNLTQIYGKTYGASKKETALLCLAVAHLSKHVEMYEICEQDLRQLPAPDANVIMQMGNVDIIQTNKTMERRAFEADANFRSPTFIYNLFDKFHDKECAFCNCTIPTIIAGAHVWGVAEIKRAETLSLEEKLARATDGENGLWLCHNHHKMFDENLVAISGAGKILYANGLNDVHRNFIDRITTKDIIPEYVFTDKFAKYLDLRNRAIA